MKVLQGLIKIPSISGQEVAIQKYIFRSLEKLGLAPIPVGGNVVVKIAGTNNKKALIFNAHVDTVESGSLDKWQLDPFSGKIIGNKIFGLGASDEKAAVATQLLLAEQLMKDQPACDVWLAFVVKEELDGSGTKEFVTWFAHNEAKKYNKLAVVLGEPTGLKEIELAHKGNMFLKVTTFGDSGHGSKPENISKHAVMTMYQAVETLKKLGEVWAKKYYDDLLGKPTISLTSIQAGSLECPNKFPDQCTATFDVRTTPQVHDLALKLIKKALPLANVELVCEPASFGFTDKNESIVQVVCTVSRAKLAVSDGSTDLCFFTAAGVPGVIFGPGEKGCIHKPNEYCEAAKIGTCVDIYSRVVGEFANS